MLAKATQPVVAGTMHDVACGSCGWSGRDWAGFPCESCKGTTLVSVEALPECDCDACRNGFWFCAARVELVERFSTLRDAITATAGIAGEVVRYNKESREMRVEFVRDIETSRGNQ